MKVKYVGDPNDDFSGPRKLTVGGRTFIKDEEVDVPQGTLHNKLLGHNHFEVEGRKEPVVEGEEDVVEEEVVVHTIPECKAILDDRKVKYCEDASLEDLQALVEANGGFPEPEGE